jgi:hypothetical protein
MYRQLAPQAQAPSSRLITEREKRLSEIGPGCVYCGDTANTQDHIEPLVLCGMPTDLTATALDMLPCCGPCNSSKGANTWRDYMARTKRKAANHTDRIKWISGYDRWRRRHAQRWPVQEHMKTILRLNTMVAEAHSFMQGVVNETVRAIHGEAAVLAHARETTFDWTSIKRQVFNAHDGVRTSDTPV